MRIAIASGKGGSGKTSIVASLASLAGEAVLADCDVGAADLHLVLSPEVVEENSFCGGIVAEIDQEKCTGCGKCLEICRFDAIEKLDSKDLSLPRKGQALQGESSVPIYSVNKIACEGCAVCAYFCPEDAIDLVMEENGRWYVSNTRFGKLVHARFHPGRENSGKLVTIVRTRVKEIAQKEERRWILIDGSPGVGCPVIASLTGVDLALIVSEPTQSGIHDLRRVAGLAGHFDVKTMILINKSDINPDMTEEIISYAGREGISVAGEVVYSDDFARAQIEGKSVIEYSKTGKCAKGIRNIWRRIVEAI